MIASFFQHDSREHDPQLHIHNAVLNRVQGPDGKWRTIDSKALHRCKPAAGAVGERVMEQHLVKSLGVQFKERPDGKAREIVGIDQAVMDLFSSRRKAITKKTAALVRAFEARMGREPNNLELAYMQQQASLATRKAKSHDGETVEQRLERWDRQLRAEVRGGLGKVARDVLALRQRQWLPGRINQAKVLETALAEVQAKHATWRSADLTRAISDALPDNLGNMKPAKIARLLDRLTERGLRLAQQVDADRPGQSPDELAALPDELRRGDGSSAYSAPGAARYVTPDHVKAERQLAKAGYARGAAAMSPTDVQAFVKRLAADGLQLGDDQAAAVRGILTSGAKVETLIGPAGTGKSRVVGALAKAWEDPDLWDGEQRRMIGLAASQVATEVLAADGVTAKNITRWLMTQQRLTDGSTTPEDQAWALRAGDLVVVDESAMANTDNLSQIQAHCDAAGAKLLLVGDHRQLAAVGAGGGMELVAAGALTHELTETRRFTNEWEGPASLRLRQGDEGVLAEYHKQGRILAGGHLEAAHRSAADAWLADHLNGLHALLIVDTNAQAAELSAQLRARLVEYGQVDDERTTWLASTGNRVGAGDLIQTRLNAWHLNGYRGNKRAAFNRDEFKVVEVLDDGGLRVAPLIRGTRQPAPGETMVLPASYVRDWVALGYAATVHSSQGDADDAAVDEHREVTDEHELADVAEQRDTDMTLAIPADEFVEAAPVNDQLASKDAEPDLAANEIPDAEIVADDNTATAQASAEVAEAAEDEAAEDRAVLDNQAPADIREVAAGEQPVAESDTPRVPSADETAEAVRRAQRALIEIQHRRAAEERHAAAEAEARAEELARWHTEDTNAEQANTATATAADQAADDHVPVMELGRYDDE
ncbi:conjugative relaxase-like TrwC/TraI family protein [Kribbella orskensis]|uniref:Conjugative relaxase-like TrwC/TraI family protein n=1 Tax=Kribbella orskensis TaxID=2512216 RepID=A0ABY2BF24_9ACTN|nr:conjugative relaxase-like TrwC/TraI family protein [Kribbella sp. VKM Ac-2500]TCO18277.1 conjugative relaxase-like TrwC/TraI family protein [Kribbella orskensis]